MSKNPTLRAPSYGDIWLGQGGIVVDFVPPTKDRAGWYLIAPTGPEAEAESIAWGERGTIIAGATDDWDGAANTKAMLASGKSALATWAAGLVIEGHKDFYIPSRREQRLLWARAPELFQPRWYWSSTQHSADYAWGQNFGNGYQYDGGKSFQGRARAVRRFLID